MRRVFLLGVLCCAVLPAADTAAEKEVRAAMEAWRQARIHHDRAALEKLYAPELEYVHSNAKVESRKEAIDTIANGKERVDTCEFQNMTVRTYGNTAVARARLLLRTTADGQTTTLDMLSLHVWVRNPSGWQLVARQTTRLNQ